jgi:hypothetical protein
LCTSLEGYRGSIRFSSPPRLSLLDVRGPHGEKFLGSLKNHEQNCAAAGILRRWVRLTHSVRRGRSPSILRFGLRTVRGISLVIDSKFAPTITVTAAKGETAPQAIRKATEARVRTSVPQGVRRLGKASTRAEGAYYSRFFWVATLFFSVRSGRFSCKKFADWVIYFLNNAASRRTQISHREL